jgi:hypothetical protein
MEIDLNAVRAAVRAARQHEVFHEYPTPDKGEPVPKFVLERVDDRVLGPVLDPLIEAAGGPDPVIDSLAPHKGDPDVAEALWYVLFFGDPEYYGARQRNMLTVFSEDEIVEAAVQLLLEFREDHFTDARGLPHWGWDALWQHEYYEADHLPNDAAFRMLLAVIERVPMDDKILWMIGDGPLYKARQDEDDVPPWSKGGIDVEYRRRVEQLSLTEPKVARAIELAHDYWARQETS